MNAVTKPESSALATLTSKLAMALDIGDGSGLAETLKATAFRSKPDNPVSDAQLTALLIVANQYGLNPWTKEIYAFPDKNNGIVPVVGVDGWSRIINKHPQFDGIEFAQDADACTCTIYRKDRSHPTSVTEYMVECKRPTVQPWQTHPYRMLRHKAMIQCARLAFGFVGIFEQDEAERIVESTEPKHMGPADVVGAPPAPPATYPAADFDKNLQAWAKAVGTNKKTRDELLAMVQTKGALTDDQLQRLDAAIEKAKPIDATTTGEIVMTYAQVADKLNNAADADKLAVAGSLIATVADETQRKELAELYDRRADELNPA